MGGTQVAEAGGVGLASPRVSEETQKWHLSWEATQRRVTGIGEG